MNTLLATCVLVIFAILITCGLVANMFLYSRGLFRADRLQAQHDEQVWQDLWSTNTPSDAEKLVQ